MGFKSKNSKHYIKTFRQNIVNQLTPKGWQAMFFGNIEISGWDFGQLTTNGVFTLFL